MLSFSSLSLILSISILTFWKPDKLSNKDIHIIFSKLFVPTIPLLTFSVISGTSEIKKYLDSVLFNISLILSSASSNLIRLVIAPILDKASHIKIISGLLSIIKETISPLLIPILLNLLMYFSTSVITSSLW